MKNLTLLKIASLFIFLLSAQSSFAQLNCSDYPDWYQTTWYNSDVVHYNGKLYSPCYSSTVANLTIASNRTETTSPCFTFWGFVADCVNCSTVGGSTSSNATVCSGSNSGTITLSGHNGSIVRWEKSTNNWSTTTNISNTTTTQSYSNITSTTQYRAVVKDGSCSQLNSSATTITVNSAPTASFSASATAVDTTQTITFTNSSSNASSYSWNFGDSTTSSATSPNKQYASAGTYTVTLTATNSCGNNTATTSITVCSTVGGSTSSNATVCSGSNSGTITLSGHNGSIVRWEKSTNNWSTTTTIPNTTTTQSYSNITSTTQYRAVVKDGSCSQLNSSATTITVNSAPTALFSASATAVDTTQTITFTNNSTSASSYSWNFGDSTTSSATSPNKQYASAGTYTVTLTATNSCGSDTATTSITVNIPSETIAIQDFDGATPSWSYTDAILGSSTVDLFFEDLTGESNGDTTGSASGINWALSGGGGGELYVHGGSGDHVHMSKNDGTIAVWQTTDNIDITSYANLNFTVKVRKTVNLDSDDYVKLLYSKNGGALIEIATYYDDMPDDTIIGGDINSLIGNPGDTIKLFMHVRNNSNSEQFEWEEIKLTGIELVDGDGTINSLGTNTTNAWGNKGSLDEAQITFNTVDLSNHDNLNFSFDYFIDSETEPSGQYEDNFVYDIYYNGSETASLTEELIVDGGVEDSWTSRSVSVPDGTTSIKVIFNYDVTGASTEYLGIDNVKVTGIIKLPGCATNLAPTNTATNVSVTPTLSWDVVSGATGYKVFYGTDSNTSTAVAETASTSVTLPTLPESTLHYWKVVPTNARGDASGCSVISFTTETLIPDCATGLTPADGTTGVSLTTSLSWTAANGATSYKVYFDDSNATTLIYTGSNTSIAAPTLQNGTQYYWKVVATNASGDATGCGNAISFTTIVAAPGCASYISPTDGAIDISLTPELSWSATTGATGYKVYYSSDSSNLGDPITLGEVTSYQLPQLGYNTQYFWKVVPTNAGGEATGCSVISFTTLKNPAGSVFITGNTVTVSKNAYLYLEKDFTNTGGSLTLNSSSTEFASIIVAGTASGNITYNKFVNLQGNQSQYWDLVGSPVLGQDMAAFADTNIANNGPLSYEGNQYGIGQFLTDQGYFENYTGTLSGGTIISTGGSIENAGDFPAAKGFQMATFWGDPMAFTGEVATTTQTINIQNQNGANGGVGLRWNLVANPFPSYLKGNGAPGSTDNFLRVNAGIVQSNYLGVYGWNANGSYDVYNYATGSNGVGSDLLIAPGQGFFVAAASTDVAQLQFTPAMRTVQGGDDFISGAPMLLYYNFDLKLFHGNSEKAETKYFFQEGLTLGLDPGYDAGALNQLTPLSSRLPEDDQGVNFQINAMSLESAYNQTVPLVINQEQGQSFRISISENTIPEEVNVYLEDVLNGTLTSLKDQDFELIAQEDLSEDGRFYIRFTTQNLTVNDVLSPSTINVYKINTDSFITIKGLTPEMGKTTATLYNILGMKVRENTLNNTAATQHISTQGLASGVYIIKIKVGEQGVSKKVIIQ